MDIDLLSVLQNALWALDDASRQIPPNLDEAKLNQYPYHEERQNLARRIREMGAVPTTAGYAR